jgi:guanine deaminase
MERAVSLEEELFVLQMMGDDRAVAETYVAGSALKSRLQKPGGAVETGFQARLS